MDRLKGKVAIVTGASRGIGEGIARMFAAEGASVLLAARTEEKLRAVQDGIRDQGWSAEYLVTDVAVTADIAAMVQCAVDRFGAVDVLVNNAGIPSFSRTLDADDLEQEYDRLMATNVKSAWMAIHYALPHFRARGGGSIVQIASVHGISSGGHMSAYAASKGALIAGTRAMASELAPDRVRVNCISPGTIWLDEPGGWIKRRLGEDLWQEFTDRFGDWPEHMRTLQQPLPVGGLPIDVAYCATYLASDEARFVTGANFVVDGGMSSVLSDPAFLPPGVETSLATRRDVRAWFQEALKRKDGPS